MTQNKEIENALLERFQERWLKYMKILDFPEDLDWSSIEPEMTENFFSCLTINPMDKLDIDDLLKLNRLTKRRFMDLLQESFDEAYEENYEDGEII